MRKYLMIPALTAACVSLISCSSAREQLGLNKSVPDEFAVVKRAPLALPPDYSLRPPRPGADRPQEQRPYAAAQQTVFGIEQPSSSYAATEAESLLLQKAGAHEAQADIRETIQSEQGQISEANQAVADKLIGWGDSEEAASVVNAKEEAERIRDNMEQGKPVTEGETPTIEE